VRFTTWVEIDLDALARNIDAVKASVSSGTRILMVVKADAYGHGAVEVARAAVSSGVEMFGVATLHEGIELRQAGIDTPILILSPPMAAETEEIVRYDLGCTVPSLAVARSLSRSAEARGKRAAVHVEVDTGMGRSGVGLEKALLFTMTVAKLPNLDLEGVFTHFPSSDDDPEFTRAQTSRFLSLIDGLAAKGVVVPLRHAANSGAVIAVPEAVKAPLNMVRPGLMIYGLKPAPGMAAELSPVMSFKSRIAQVRELPGDHPVSYGRTYVTERETRIAVVPAGYGHGLNFRLSNRGEVLIRGRRAPIVGRVTMDVTMVEIDGVPDAAVGDEVVLFGQQGGERISVDEVADRAGTINYEVICGIGKRVARTYLRRGETVGVRTLTERWVRGRRGVGG